ncbi:MAG TPA: hypothetical protein VFU89_04490 [Rhabdochlamydiaceae bacterium]|nr:hypothetical protein [Rhabdochlamydiaceae bacterium]
MADAVIPTSTNSPAPGILSTSTSSYVHPASATPEMMEGTNRANDVGLKAFEKAKASRSYGIIAHIYYGVILRLKDKIVHLSGSQGPNFELYQAHTALCAQIDKVKSVYKAYRTAQKTADNAPLDPEVQRRGARRKAQTAGDELVKQYDQLIELAVKNANDLGFSKYKKDYLDDVQKELSGDAKDHILQTVNQLRARKPVESPTVAQNRPDLTNKNYTEFVADFVSQVHVANQKSGGCADLTKISSAFIEGLASIHELADGLTLIDLYDELNRQAQQTQKKQFEDTVEDFSTQLEDLMKKEGDITDEELKSIYSHGIALSSVSSLTAADLNRLKNARKERLTAEEELKVAKNELAENQKVATDKTDYSLLDIKAFLQEAGKDLSEVPDAAKGDGTASGKLLKVINERDKDIEGLTKKLEKTKEESGKQHEEDMKKVTVAQEILGKATTEKAGLDALMKIQVGQLADAEAEVKELNKEYEIAKKQPSNKDTPRLNKHATDMLNEGYKKAKAELNLLVDRIKQGIEATKREQEAQETIINQQKTDLPSFLQTAEENAKTAEDIITELNKELVDKQIDTMISLSGAEVAEIGRALNVGDLSSKRSKIAVACFKAMTADEKVKKLSGETIPAHEENIKVQNEILEDDALMVMNSSGAFVVSDKLFDGTEVKQSIGNQIKSNLDIATKVTIAVAEEAVRQENAYAESQKQPKTKVSARQQQVENRVSWLGAELAKRGLKSGSSLFKEIRSRVEGLPATVNPAPASTPDEKITLLMDESDTTLVIDEVL